MSPESFLALVKNQNPSIAKFQNKTLWLNKGIQSQIKTVLGHKYPKIRLRYKTNESANGDTQPYPNLISVWYLEEIGKERPISFGVVIKNDQIQIIRVLEFRESRGYEINTARFVKQFEQIGVDETGKLDRTIDGITGATLSVRAMKKIARVALMLHRQAMKNA